MIGTTPVPNKLLDQFLSELHGAEIKVLLVIIRKTLGWQDRRSVHGRKEKDWIASSQFTECSGCSRRAISSAIDVLTKKNLIRIYDKFGNVLQGGDSRKGKQQLFYGLAPTLFSSGDNLGITNGNTVQNGITYAKNAVGISKNVIRLAQKMRITK